MHETELRRGTRRMAAAALGLAAAALGAALAPSPARACGGLFCNNANPVNQAAERIVFTKEPGGTVWATIEIRYEGRAEDFAWLLPVEGEPEVQLGATRFFDVLQQNTNPTYQVTTTTDGCGFDGGCSGGCASAAYSEFPDDRAGSAPAGMEPVEVLRQERLGPYDYVLIGVAEGTDDPAAEAVRWLQDNGFDVYDDQAATLRPYLQAGQNLLAFRLAKDADTGAIRPLRIQFGRGLPSIPLRPTAVAVNDDMPIMVFVLGEHRAVPVNYRLVTLNDALINWLNPSSNYLRVLTAAIDEAGGQGFVTEYAGGSDVARDQVLTSDMRSDVMDFRARVARVRTDRELVQRFVDRFAGWEGVGEVLRAHTTVDRALIDEMEACDMDAGVGTCTVRIRPEDLPADFDRNAFVEDVERQVIEPVEAAEEMLQRHEYLTRLVTTMSAEDMTLDPMFDFNPDLEDVSNQHTMRRVVRCLDEGEEEWRGRTETGLLVWGSNRGQWPFDDPIEAGVPAALRIERAGADGVELVEDNRATIEAALMPPDEGGCRLTRTQRGTTGQLLMLGLLALWLGSRRRRLG